MSIIFLLGRYNYAVRKNLTLIEKKSWSCAVRRKGHGYHGACPRDILQCFGTFTLSNTKKLS